MGTYRLEEASTGRAGCQNKECKDQKIKIAKGEFRLGTWVDTEKFQSFFWRHWGCVTPKIVAGLKEILDEADGDYSAIDGFEEISEENQAKVREAIEQGHVSDSDWKGDVEMNRPGKHGYRAKATKKKASAKENGSKSDAEEEAPAAKKGRAGAKAKKETAAAKANVESAGSEEEVPVKKRGRPAKSAASAEKKTEKEAKPAAKGGKRKLADADADAETAAAENPDPRPSKKGRKSAGAEESVAVEEKPKRGRKKAAPTHDQEADKEPSEKKPTRGRKKASA